MKNVLLISALLSQMAFASRPELIGGRPAVPGEFPASVYTRQGSSRCTATLVGPRALLIAAHCVDAVKDTTFSAGGNVYQASCEIASGYAQNETADWAMCLVSKDVVNVEFEILNQKDDIVKVGDQLLLTGYGCIEQGGGRGNDGIYRIGESKVIRLPYGRSHDIVTKAPSSALCFGDSGGPVFKEFKDGSRLLVGVNSRGNIRDTSYLSAVGNAEFHAFVSEWSERTGAEVCGLQEDVSGCRDITK